MQAILKASMTFDGWPEQLKQALFMLIIGFSPRFFLGTALYIY